MKLIAGRWGGRQLVYPKTPATRPMTDKVRAALFNTLGSVEGLRVLDAYAGSGAIGLEALSRGAAQLVVVEKAKAALDSIRRNAEALEATVDVDPRGVEAWVKTASRDFDLIIADPPYDFLDSSVIDQLGEQLAPNGRLVLSHASRIAAPTLQSVQLVKSSRYGDSTLSFYTRPV